MRKVSILAVFISLVWFVSFVSSSAFAQTMAPPTSDASKNQALVPVTATTELAKPVLLTTTSEAFNKRWSYSADLHGSPAPGIGLMLHSPVFWNFLGLRAGYNFDSAGTGSNRKAYGAVAAGLKFNTFADSSNNLYPYVQLNFDFYTNTSSGEKLGFEVLYGAEWRHKVVTFSGAEIDHAVFIEGGWGNSDATVNAISIGDGFVTRLGVRRLF